VICAEKNEFKSIGCDYLTCTMNTRSDAIKAATKAATLLRSEVARGNLKKPWGMSGFSGWKAGSLQFGRREDEVIVRLSGHLAHTNWRYFYALANNISRFDIECTSYTGRGARERILRHRRETIRWANKRKKPPFVGCYSGNDGSNTIYLNRRSSMSMGRIYDKGRESKQAMFLDSVRYEIEFKRDMAKIVARECYESKTEMSTIAERCARWFIERGTCLPRGWEPGLHSGVAQTASDSVRRLAWLRASVRPSVMSLVSTTTLDEIITALGLENLVIPAHGTLSKHQTRKDNRYVN
jgi:DNA relaxase NicK